MSSQKFSDSNLTPLPPAKPDTLLVSDPLTRAEFLPSGLYGPTAIFSRSDIFEWWRCIGRKEHLAPLLFVGRLISP
jgi:hypothetical protein